VVKKFVDQWLTEKSAAQADAAALRVADANFLSSLSAACQADIPAARQHFTYDNFQRELTEEQVLRDGWTKTFDEIKIKAGF
jgi:hypothetical protein